MAQNGGHADHWETVRSAILCICLSHLPQTSEIVVTPTPQRPKVMIASPLFQAAEIVVRTSFQRSEIMVR